MQAALKPTWWHTLDRFSHIIQGLHIFLTVLDDDDSSITAGSIVTVTVTLKRTNLLDNYDSSLFEGE